MKHDLFISYSRADKKEVSEFLSILQQHIPDIDYWFDFEGIESGDEFEEKIVDAIDSSDYVLIFLSEPASRSPWTKQEIGYALNVNKKVIPILLAGAVLKGWFLFRLGQIDCIDITDQMQCEKLFKNLADWIGKKSDHNVDSESAKHAVPASVKNNSSGIADTKLEVVESLQKSVASSKKNSNVLSTKKKKEETFSPDSFFSRSKARTLYQRACILYSEEKYFEAFPKILEASELGNPKAQYLLGYCYDEGRGVRQDQFKAVAWYRKAAVNGIADAQCNLGYCLDEGVGVEPDESQAVSWYLKASAQGNARATYNLGLCYEFGTGVEKNSQKAINFYRKAAQAGYDDALSRIKKLEE